MTRGLPAISHRHQTLKYPSHTFIVFVSHVCHINFKIIDSIKSSWNENLTLTKCSLIVNNSGHFQNSLFLCEPYNKSLFVLIRKQAAF